MLNCKIDLVRALVWFGAVSKVLNYRPSIEHNINSRQRPYMPKRTEENVWREMFLQNLVDEFSNESSHNSKKF